MPGGFDGQAFKSPGHFHSTLLTRLQFTRAIRLTLRLVAVEPTDYRAVSSIAWPVPSVAEPSAGLVGPPVQCALRLLADHF